MKLFIEAHRTGVIEKTVESPRHPHTTRQTGTSRYALEKLSKTWRISFNVSECSVVVSNQKKDATVVDYTLDNIQLEIVEKTE